MEEKNINTVNLSLEEYNLLRDFKSEIEKNHTVHIGSGWAGSTYLHTMDDAVKEIAKQNNKLTDEIYDLKHPDTKQLSIEEIKALGWWKFRKWKAGRL